MNFNKEFKKVETQLKKLHTQTNLTDAENKEIDSLRNLYERTAKEFNQQIQIKFMKMEINLIHKLKNLPSDIKPQSKIWNTIKSLKSAVKQ